MMADEAGALFEREGRAVRQQRQRFSRSFANLELRDKRWTRAQADRRDKRQEENKEPGRDLRVCDAPRCSIPHSLKSWKRTKKRFA
jgi:hypothetical protein